MKGSLYLYGSDGANGGTRGQGENMMVRQVYADGVTNVTFTGGMVRIDLASLPAGPTHGKEPRPMEIHDRVVLTPQAFLRSMRLLEDIMKKMAEAGVYNAVQPSEDNKKPAAAIQADAVH